MNGKIPATVIAVIAVIAGIAIYYLQVHAYYQPVLISNDPSVTGATRIELTSIVSGEPEVILAENFEGIDATSSPLRFRGCFTTPMSLGMLSETYVSYEKAVPLITPGWFECFDPEDIGAKLETGEALAFLSHKNIADGVDRIVAVFPDGRAFVWHQLNDTYAD